MSRFVIPLLALALLLPSQAEAHAAGRSGAAATLPVVKPIIPCEALATADVAALTGVATKITSATVLTTPKGRFCKVTGTLIPSIVFEANLPMERWTQRFVEAAMGRNTIINGGTCGAALNGEFAVASGDRGYSGTGQMDSSWTPDMQLRIDWAHRGNHETAIATKALIRIYYGRAPQYSYFLGCSEGGREALLEAQRYPEDFDGVAAGAPVAIDSVHNSFYHPWENEANPRRADGSRMLVADRLEMLHRIVVAHCAASAGLIDGLLQQPTACAVDRRWFECPTDKADTSECLTHEEADVVMKLYDGPSDGKGNHFEITGFPAGSEIGWKLSTATAYGDRETKEGFALRRLLPPPLGNKAPKELEESFAFTREWFDRVNELAPLYNAANTDLAPFAARGGKLILWHGAADTIVQPAISVAYYQGVEATLGKARTDATMRFFLFPGMAHCTGGEGPYQFDVLSPLMAWVEGGHAPARMLASLPAQTSASPAPGNRPPPYAEPHAAAAHVRPVYPFPAIARYDGKGDPTDPASYVRAASGISLPQHFDTLATSLIGPHNQKTYTVKDNRLVEQAR